MKADQERAAEENQRLARELDALRARPRPAKPWRRSSRRCKDERDVIRTRVGDMLDQLEALEPVDV